MKKERKKERKKREIKKEKERGALVEAATCLSFIKKNVLYDVRSFCPTKSKNGYDKGLFVRHACLYLWYNLAVTGFLARNHLLEIFY
jgi:hypothetical protein